MKMQTTWIQTEMKQDAKHKERSGLECAGSDYFVLGLFNSFLSRFSILIDSLELYIHLDLAEELHFKEKTGF